MVTWRRPCWPVPPWKVTIFALASDKWLVRRYLRLRGYLVAATLRRSAGRGCPRGSITTVTVAKTVSWNPVPCPVRGRFPEPFIRLFPHRQHCQDSLTSPSSDAKATWCLKHFLGSPAEGPCLWTTDTCCWWEVTAGTPWYSNHCPAHLVALTPRPASWGRAPPPGPAPFTLSAVRRGRRWPARVPRGTGAVCAPASPATTTRTAVPESAGLSPEGSGTVSLAHSDLPFEAASDRTSPEPGAETHGMAATRPYCSARLLCSPSRRGRQRAGKLL